MGWNGGFFGAMVIALLAAGVSAADTVGPDKVIGGYFGGGDAAFSPDGTKVFLPVYGNAAAIWDLASGDRVVEIEGHPAEINSVDFAADSATVLTGSRDATARLWSASTGELLREFAGHTGPLYAAALSPDSTRVLTASTDKTAILWDAGTGALLRTFTGHTALIGSAAISPDGTMILTASYDGTARLWDAETGTVVRTLIEPGQEPINDAAFSPDGAAVLTGADGGIARLWSIATGAELRAFTLSDTRVHGVAIAPDGNRVLALNGYGDLSIWDTGTGVEVLGGLADGLQPSGLSVSFSPDGTRLLTAGYGGGVRLWDAAMGTAIPAPFDFHGTVYSLDYSPVGDKVVAGHYDGKAVLWDAASGEPLRAFEGTRLPVVTAEFSPNGTKLLTGASDGTATLWQARTAEVLLSFGDDETRVNRPVFSPNGDKILFSTRTGEVQIRDAATGEVLTTQNPGFGRPLSIAMTPDQSRLLLFVPDFPHLAVLWDLQSEMAVHTWNAAAVAALSPDGTQVLISDADSVLRLYSTQTGAELRAFDYSGDRIWDMEFSPDGTQVATTSWDKIHLWEVATGVSTREFKDTPQYFTDVDFTSNAKHLVTGSEDGAIFIWDAAAPRITLLGDSEITIVCGDALEIPGATAYDPQDGDLSANVVASLEADDIVSSGTYTVDYSVTDSDGNAAPIVSRTIVVQDTTPPVVTLNGPAVVEMICNDLYVELGATAVDSCDGVLEVQISEVDVEKFWYENVVEIIYTATDAAGNQSEPVVRTLIVYSDDCNCKIGSSKCPPPEGEGDSQTEGEGEGSQEGAEEGEGATEGSAEGEGEGEIEGSVDGEGSADGEGELEGSVDGEGELEGSTEGDEEGEPTPPVSGPPGCFAEDGTMRPFSEVLGDWLAYLFSFALLLGAATRFRAGG